MPVEVYEAPGAYEVPVPLAAVFQPAKVSPAFLKLVGLGRLKVPLPVPVVTTADGTVPVSAPLRLNEIVELHCAYKVISPAADFQFVAPSA